MNNFFEKCLLFTRNGENFPGAWEKTFHNCPFDENKIVLNFGRELGAYDVKNQILLCNLTIDNLNTILKVEKSKSIRMVIIILRQGIHLDVHQDLLGQDRQVVMTI